MNLINECCNKKHLINIKNVVQNEEVHHTKLLLISGHVSSLCSKYYNTISTFNQSNSYTNNFNVSQINRQFKCLIKLTHGLNNIHLQYGSTIIKIDIQSNQLSHQNYTIKLLYIICDGHDGNFQSPENLANTKEIACKKIEVGIELIQCIIAEKLKEQNHCRRSFVTSANCEQFYSKLPIERAKSMTELELWNYFARELVAHYPNDNATKFVAFLGCTQYTYENNHLHRKVVTANAALGGGNLALFGTGCLYTWPKQISDIHNCFQNENYVDVTKFMDDSNSRQTFGGCFASTLGSVCHEIGHILDLGHTKTGIMGDGFDYVNRVFTIDNLTEELPERIIDGTTYKSAFAAVDTHKISDKRLTQIKSGNGFLQKYQQQKDNDLTFFERNSIVTLIYHKWIANYVENISNCIDINLKQRKITSNKCALRLIEFRTRVNGLMTNFFEFVDQDLFEFNIPQSIDVDQLDVIVLDDNGNIMKKMLNDRDTAILY